jgi:O-antigen ligase
VKSYIQFILNNIYNLYFFLICGLFIAFGFDFLSYPFLYTSGFVGGIVCIRLIYTQKINPTKYFFIPIIFFLYVTITPGQPFKDLHVTGIISAAFFAGLAAMLFYRDKLSTIFFLLPLSLVINFLVNLGTHFLFGTALLGTSGQKGRLALEFSHPNVLGEMACLGILVLLCYPPDKRSLRLLGYGLIAILSFIILLTVGRSAYLGTIAALSLYAFIHSWKKASILLVAIILTAVVAVPFMPKTQQTRISNMITNPTQDPTFQSRIPIWNHAWRKIQEAPVFGNGLRTFRSTIRAYLDQNYEDIKKENKYAEKRPAKHPHSFYLAALYGWGIVGSSLLAIICMMMVKYAIRSRHYLPLYALAFTLAFGLFDVRLLSRDGALLLFFPMGMVFTQALQITNKDEPLAPW